MRKCDDCQIILDSGFRHCPKCGKEVIDSSDTSSLPSVEVGALLTSANIHRIRHEWDEAVEDAAQAFKLDPKNPDIASLIGSIYEQRGMLEESAVWYQMALDMDPESSADRARLQRVNELIRGQAQSKSSDPNKKTLLTASIIAAVVVLAAVLVFALARGRSPEPPVRTAVGPQPAQRTGPTTDSSSTSRPQPPVNKPSQGTSDLSGTASSGSTTRTAAEMVIREAASAAPALGRLGGTVDDVIADPRHGLAFITVSLPGSRPVTRQQAMISAGAAAYAAFDAHKQVSWVTVRVLSSGGESGAQILFVGDASRAGVSSLPQNATAEQIEQVFTRPWWNPSLGRQ